MIKRRFLIIVSVSLAAFANCGSGVRSTTLSRQTALQILKAKPKLLANIQSTNLIAQFPYYLRAIASDDEVAGRVPFVLPNLDQVEKAGYSPREQASILFGQFLIHAVQDKLFFKRLGVQNENGGVKVVSWELPHEDVFWTGYQPTNCTANAVTARAAFEQVTGIHQEGNQAEVEVEIVYKPTSAYNDLRRVADETMKDMGRDPAMFSKLCMLPDYHIDFFELPGKRTMTFSFERFDDGWRVDEDSGQLRH